MIKNKYNFTNKIKKFIEICEISKSLTDKKKIAMCHGTFDLVHPGHIRHLIYAKNKADVLIVSITSDKHVIKKKDGTYIPENLRAENLAALEFVDYVFIDYNYTPINSIKKIKPNFFIKGYDYNIIKNINLKTLEEKKTVEKYGGKIIFSPGDIIYSSTKLQEENRPDLKVEKVISLLKNEKSSIESIKKLLEKKNKLKIHVIGDLIVDKYNFCNLIGQSTKTPTFSVRPIRSDLYVGGAGIVAKHFKSLGGDVTLTTIVGKDILKKITENDLKKFGVKLNLITHQNKPTTLKERFWSDNYKLLQVDYLDNSIIDNLYIEKITKFIKKVKADLIVFNDFRHGMFNSKTAAIFTQAIKKKIIKVADSQVSSRWGNILDFQKFDIIFPNEAEARFSLADQDSGIRYIGTKILKLSKSKNVVLKLGDKGSMVFYDTGVKPKDFFPLDSFVSNKIDSIGAGDAYLAATAYYYTITKNITISSIIGNFAATVACEKEGNLPIKKSEIISVINKNFL
jgi:rfaE bifunctional protein kinase chain/domain/rfaE bifunctional protein nucleotidyltransferase chain/domain